MTSKNSTPNQYPAFPEENETYTVETLVYPDTSSILSINKRGDTINLDEDRHKYFRNPLYSPGTHIALAGKNAVGNKVNLIVIDAYGVVREKDDQGHEKSMVFKVDEGLNLTGDITVGQPYTLPSGHEFSEVTNVAAWYKYGASGREVPGENPFVKAQAEINERLGEV